MPSQTCRRKVPLLTTLSEISSKKSEFRIRKVSFELKSEFRVRKVSFEFKK